MDWLNYHHFLYFWLVVREGGILPAAKKLRLAHSTVSAQLKQLEEQLGEALFDRSTRRLQLTDTGQLAFRYAEEIFPVGQEFLDTLRGRPTNKPIRVTVGLTMGMPKLVVRKLLGPAFTLPETVALVCKEDRHDRLMAELAMHNLDVVLADAPVPPGSHIRAFNHQLGVCGMTFFATAAEAKRLRRKFPQSLDGVPMLLPTIQNVLRRALDQWLSKLDITPNVIAEFDDSALLKVMGQDGHGVFCTPSAVESDVKQQYHVSVAGRTDEVREHFYAISAERRVKNPAVIAICEQARTTLFGG